MARVPGCEAVYDVANQWRERCLESDRSLLWPGLDEPTWTVENISTVETRLEQAPQGDRSGWKLLIQAIRNDAPAISRLVSDLIAIWSMTSWVPVERKQIWLQQFLEDATAKGSPEPQLEQVATGFQQANTADLYLGDNPTRRNSQMIVYLRLAKEVKLEHFDLNETHSIHSLIYRLSTGVPHGINSAASILHRLFPATYEPLNHANKRSIVKALGTMPNDISTIDDVLREIRQGLVETIGRQDFFFSDNDVASLWKSNSIAHESTSRRYWKITPGESAKHWQRFESEDAVFLGWDAVGDLRDINSGTIENVENELKANEEFTALKYSPAYGATQLWAFFKEMSIGDCVLVYGSSTIWGWGTIAGEYEFDDSWDTSDLELPGACEYRLSSSRSKEQASTESNDS